MPLAIINEPEGGTLEVRVTVTGVEPDGRFHIKGEDGLELRWCNPEKVLLFEGDERIQAVVPRSDSDRLAELAALIEEALL